MITSEDINKVYQVEEDVKKLIKNIEETKKKLSKIGDELSKKGEPYFGAKAELISGDFIGLETKADKIRWELVKLQEKMASKLKEVL